MEIKQKHIMRMTGRKAVTRTSTGDRFYTIMEYVTYASFVIGWALVLIGAVIG